jgi:two-component system, LytTR family, sensor kinase
VLARLGAAVAEHVEQLRNVQMQNLVSQAELKALQAQINPHFLFNSLNTLYGTIDRANAEARRLVLNLADVYRYLLRSERAW